MWQDIKKNLYSNEQFDINYCMEITTISSALAGTKQCTNCIGQTGLILSLLTDTSWQQPYGWKLGVHTYRDHIEPVLYNSELDRVFLLGPGVFEKRTEVVNSAKSFWRSVLAGSDMDLNGRTSDYIWDNLTMLPLAGEDSFIGDVLALLKFDAGRYGRLQIPNFSRMPKSGSHGGSAPGLKDLDQQAKPSYISLNEELNVNEVLNQEEDKGGWLDLLSQKLSGDLLEEEITDLEERLEAFEEMTHFTSKINGFSFKEGFNKQEFDMVFGPNKKVTLSSKEKKYLSASKFRPEFFFSQVNDVELWQGAYLLPLNIEKRDLDNRGLETWPNDGKNLVMYMREPVVFDKAQEKKIDLPKIPSPEKIEYFRNDFKGKINHTSEVLLKINPNKFWKNEGDLLRILDSLNFLDLWIRDVKAFTEWSTDFAVDSHDAKKIERTKKIFADLPLDSFNFSWAISPLEMEPVSKHLLEILVSLSKNQKEIMEDLRKGSELNRIMFFRALKAMTLLDGSIIKFPITNPQREFQTKPLIQLWKQLPWGLSSEPIKDSLDQFVFEIFNDDEYFYRLGSVKATVEEHVDTTVYVTAKPKVQKPADFIELPSWPGAGVCLDNTDGHMGFQGNFGFVVDCSKRLENEKNTHEERQGKEENNLTVAITKISDIILNNQQVVNSGRFVKVDSRINHEFSKDVWLNIFQVASTKFKNSTEARLMLFHMLPADTPRKTFRLFRKKGQFPLDISAEMWSSNIRRFELSGAFINYRKPKSFGKFTMEDDDLRLMLLKVDVLYENIFESNRGDGPVFAEPTHLTKNVNLRNAFVEMNINIIPYFYKVKGELPLGWKYDDQFSSNTKKFEVEFLDKYHCRIPKYCMGVEKSYTDKKAYIDFFRMDNSGVIPLGQDKMNRGIYRSDFVNPFRSFMYYLPYNLREIY